LKQFVGRASDQLFFAPARDSERVVVAESDPAIQVRDDSNELNIFQKLAEGPL